jgi:S-adenosylmethionine:tRNA ribosyltransferase-isomerase
MRIEELDYDLPPHLIAQQPAAERDLSRLLVLRRHGTIAAHTHFRNLPDFLCPGDLLVLNDTRVLPARLLGHRARTGGKWEGLFVGQQPDGAWELLCQTRGRLMLGETVLVEREGQEAPLRLCLIGKTPSGHWLARPEQTDAFPELLERFGQVPLPPYIRKGRASNADRERYQTVFACHPGAVAAPTAGLHFTPQLFEELDRHGVHRAMVTLHVGPGTFQPVQVEEVEQHRVQAEWGEVPATTATAINECRERGGRVVAIGTTAVRVLETAAASGKVRAWSGQTELTICPPFDFRAIDVLITNFHLPRSSLLLLVAAFTGLESLRAAYRTAVEMGYRFYSYGDATLIV